MRLTLKIDKDAIISILFSLVSFAFFFIIWLFFFADPIILVFGFLFSFTVFWLFYYLLNPEGSKVVFAFKGMRSVYVLTGLSILAVIMIPPYTGLNPRNWKYFHIQLAKILILIAFDLFSSRIFPTSNNRQEKVYWKSCDGCIFILIKHFRNFS